MASTKKKYISLDKRRTRLAYAFIAPSLLYLLIFQLYPLLESLRSSFTDYSLIKPNSGKFVGLLNFQNLLFIDENFWGIFLNTIKWITIPTLLQYSVGLAFGLLLSKRIRLRPLWRGLIMVPWVTPVVIAGLIWQWLYDGQYGLINYYLGTNVVWLADKSFAWPSLLFMALWKGMSYATTMMLAGLQGIPIEIHEVSLLDGAGFLKKFFYITLPLIKPVLYTSVATSIVMSWVGFEVIWVLTSGGPGFTTSTLATYIYTKSFLFYSFGEGAAVSVVSMVMLVMIILVYLKLFKRRGNENE